MLPPEPHEEAYGYYGNLPDPQGQGYGYGDPNAGVLQGQAPPRRLRSAKQGISGVFVGIVIILMLGIVVAIFYGFIRKPSGPPEGDGVIAKVDSVQGEVVLMREIGKQDPLESGYELREGDVITVRRGSARVAYVEEKTYLHIRSGTELTLGKQSDGKQVRLGQGVVTVEAASQPVGQPMLVRSANAEVSLKSGRVTVRNLGKETLVEVGGEVVRVERGSDGATVEVPAGCWTLMKEQALPQVWEFLAGVNLNGGEVAVDGGNWLSDAKAQSEGLKVEADGKEGPVERKNSAQQPIGYVSGPGLQGMLMSKVSVSNAKLSLRWPQENGSYQVFLWMMEDEADSARSLRLNVQSKPLATELGRGQTLGSWDRFGPYPAEVKDGSLNLLISANSKGFQSREAHLSGFAVYRLKGTGSPRAQGTARGVGMVEVDPVPSGESGRIPAVVPTVPD